MNVLKYLNNLLKYLSLPVKDRRVIFYSEGKDYWSYLQGLIVELVEEYYVSVCYLTSDYFDPGLIFKNDRYNAFVIGDGHIRSWLFENITAELVVLTMPDLNQYQIKRSKNKVHYIYVQHSLASLHTIYRNGAFDYFDTIFCAGPHHEKEIMAMEFANNLPKKKLVRHGYSLLDLIIQESKSNYSDSNNLESKKNILIAPSWGPNGIIETLGLQIIDILLISGYNVILRPHPQTKKLYPDAIYNILSTYGGNKYFKIDEGLDNRESLYKSDLMISDWSGVVLEYAFGLKKPVLFIDVPRKINNPDHAKINIEPFEVWIREVVGYIISPQELNKLDDYIKFSFSKKLSIKDYSKYVYNISNSASIGAKYIYDMLQK